jgi:hypothetical protein
MVRNWNAWLHHMALKMLELLRHARMLLRIRKASINIY